MNIKDSISNLKIKDFNINYIDLNKLNFLKIKNKNPNPYYMINGSRKINLPEVSDMSEASAKNIFSEVSPFSEKTLTENTLSGGVKKSGKKKSHKKDLSSTSFTFSDATETAKNVNITSVSGGGSSSSSTSNKKSSASSTSSSSSSTASEKMSRQRNRYNDMSYNSHLDNRTKSKLDRLPDNYFDLAPDHLLNGMQNMPQDMGMPQEDMGMPQEDMGMPQDMGMGQMAPQMPMGMPQMAPQMPMGMPQMPMGMGQIPPMPADMQQAAMGNGMAPQMHPQLNVPMMNNPMASFMGMGQGMGQGMQMGGSSQPLQKYKLTLDKFFF